MVLARGVAEVVIKARDLASKELNKTENRMKSLARIAGRTLPIAIGAAAGAMGRMAVVASDAAQQIARASDAAGLSTDTYQALAGTLQAAGSDGRALDSAMRRLQQTFSDAARGEAGAGRLLSQLGIDARDSTGSLKDMEAALPEVLEALGLMENRTTAAGIAAKVLGRNWADVQRALGESVDEYNAAVASALDSGQIIGGDLIQQGDDAANAWDNMGQVLDAVSKTLSLQLAPAVESLASAVNDYFEGGTLERAAKNDVGGLRELRGELHLLEAEFADFERRWSAEHGMIDVFPLGAIGSGALVSAGFARQSRRMVKELEAQLDRVASGVGSRAKEGTRRQLFDRLGEADDLYASNIKSIKAQLAAAGGEGFLSLYIRSLGNAIPEAQKILKEINRLVGEIGETPGALAQADKSLAHYQDRFKKRFNEFSEKAAGTSFDAPKGEYLRRAMFHLSLENYVGEQRKKIADQVARETAAAEAERENKRQRGEEARRKQAIQVWQRYYAGLEVVRAQAFGDEEVLIDAQWNKRNEALEVALKQYEETGASDAMLEKARQDARILNAEIHEQQMLDAEHDRLKAVNEFHAELLQTDALTERERLDSTIRAYQVQIEEYDRYLSKLDEGTDRYREIMMERTRIARQQLQLQVDQQYKSTEDGLAIANYAVQAAAAINKKGERESRDQFERRKQLESSLAAINTASAAVAVMKNVAQAGGWSPLAIAEMGFILAAGAAQQRAIQSATYSGVGGGGGSAGGLDSTAGAVEPVQRPRTDVRIFLRGRRNFTVEDIDEIVEGIADAAARNGGYVGNVQIAGRG